MAKAIMIQGTMSSAGKSFLTAGLCRVFRQDGWRVAPFKSQNMALNSYITREGLEMGRAQVMQAEAAKVEPSVLMNPILLKPMSDMGSQVIVMGEVVGNMQAAEYFRYKETLVPRVREAYETLAREHDIIVIEGAGSPAEINLKDSDLVNMGMARMARAPVLLAGDIDRGGVFASVYGTVALLTPEERKMLRGVIINKFRGDAEILRPGLATLEELTGVPVLGVVPYTPLDLDDEDSLAERLGRHAAPEPVDVAVIRLPHISNFTDFNPLEQVGGLGVRYARDARLLGTPDLVILPGTKNTLGDLLWLREMGLEAAICRLAERGVPIVGICGGYQMLGRSISDPHGVEQGGTVEGLGLLPVDTVFEQEKTRTRATGQVARVGGPLAALAGAPVEGYEIHMGRTEGEAQSFAWIGQEGGEASPDGAWRENVYGTYLHGLFDSPAVVQALARALFAAKGLDEASLAAFDGGHKERQYDLLAETIRNSLDMERVYRILEEGL